jgi:hypothetical protein
MCYFEGVWHNILPPIMAYKNKYNGTIYEVNIFERLDISVIPSFQAIKKSLTTHNLTSQI